MYVATPIPDPIFVSDRANEMIVLAPRIRIPDNPDAIHGGHVIHPHNGEERYGYAALIATELVLTII